MIFAHQLALDLTQEQEAYCRQAAGTARFTYNWGLAHWQMQYRNGEKPTAVKLKKQWNAIKYERYPWLADIHRDAHSQPFANLSTAFGKFFRHEAKYPTFKKKRDHASFYIANDKVQFRGTQMRMPVLGWVRMREALRFTGKLMSVTVSCVAGRWFASVTVQLETAPPHCENQAVVGVDLGIKALAMLSTGEAIVGPKPLRTLQQQLRRCSKGLSRKVKGSANWHKAKQKLSRLHYRIACQRKDCLHKLTTDLVARFGTIVIEDLHVKGMVKNHKLARAISDMGWGMFRQMLTYKAEAGGVTLVLADHWFPSSKLCSVCGCLKETLTLDERTYNCADCGATLERDLNAALNLRNYPGLQGKSTPVESGALATTQRGRETLLDEAGTNQRVLLYTS